MKFPPELERKVLRSIRTDPDAHIVFPPESYRPDGKILVYRANMSVFLHRYLAEQVITGFEPTLFYIKTCEVTGCMNPLHYGASSHPNHRQLSHCPNGHPYNPATDLRVGPLRCAICAERRRELRAGRSQATINREKTHCPNGHPYTPQNTYVWADQKNRVHRKCKTCTLERTQPKEEK